MDLTLGVAFNRPFFMVEDTDHITGATGLSITATISKDCAAFGSPVGTITELGDGWYFLALDDSDVDTLGALAFHMTATGADPLDFADNVVATGIMRGSAFADFQFKMSDSSGDGVTGLVDGDFSLKEFSIGGGANGTLAGTITEDPGGNGFYLISFLASELAGRSIALTFLATGTIVTQLTLITSQ